MAPSFGAMCARAAVRAARRSKFAAGWVVAAGALTAAAVFIVVVTLRPDPPTVPDVGKWESPTAFLLRSPGDALLRDVPALGTSAIPIIRFPNVPGGTR